MNISKAKNIHKATSNEPNRYAMDCVAIRDNKGTIEACATTGRILTVTPLGTSKDLGPLGASPLLIPYKTWKAATSGPARDMTTLHVDGPTYKIRKGPKTTEGADPKTMEYPRVDAILDNPRGEHRVRLNAEYLKTLLDSMSSEFVDLYVGEANSQVRLVGLDETGGSQASGFDENGEQGIIMPISV